MAAVKKCDALVAVLGAEPLNNATACLFRLVCKPVVPCVRLIVEDNERADGAGPRASRADLDGRCRLARAHRGRMRRHELRTPGQARQRHQLESGTPKIIASLAMPIDKPVYEGRKPYTR